MNLTPEQIKKLWKPFDDVGAFKGRSDEEVSENRDSGAVEKAVFIN